MVRRCASCGKTHASVGAYGYGYEYGRPSVPTTFAPAPESAPSGPASESSEISSSPALEAAAPTTPPVLPALVVKLATVEGGALDVFADGTWSFTDAAGNKASGAPSDKIPACAPAAPIVATPSVAVAPVRRVVPVTVYGTSTCPRTRRARAHLEGRGVPYTFGDLGNPATASDLFRKLGNPGSGTTPIPVIELDGRLYVGWDEGFFDNAYDAASRG